MQMSVTEALGEGPEAYERLMADALMGDARLFARQDSVEEARRIFDGVLENGPPVEHYVPGSWGPARSSELLHPEDEWHTEDELT